MATRLVGACLAVLLVAPGLLAQDQGRNIRREIDEIKRKLDRVMTENERISDENRAVRLENAELKSLMENASADGSELEDRINSLTESFGNDFAGTTVNSGANPITVGGVFRVRSGYTTNRDFGIDSTDGSEEDDDGTFSDAFFLVSLDFELTEHVRTHIAWKSFGLFHDGDTPGGDGSLSQVGLDTGWIEIGNLFGKKELTARTGRQVITLGNQFQFGDNDFFAGDSHDGTRWWWDNESFQLNFIFAKMDINDSFNTRDHPYTGALAGNGFDDDEMYALYFTLKSIKDAELDLYVIYFNGNNGGSLGTLGNALGAPAEGDGNKDSSGDKFYYVTIGARFGGVLASVADGLDYNLEVAYQSGDLKDASDTDVEGLAVEAEVGITFNSSNNFRVYLRFLYSEGAEDDDSGYIPLFTERHSNGSWDDHTAYKARYGLMDIIPLDNVLTLQIGIHFDPAPDWRIGATFLYAEHDEDVPTASGSEDGIGFEIDLYADYRHSNETTFSFGLGFFFPDEGAPFKQRGGGVRFAGDDEDDIAVLFFTQVLVVF